MDVYLLCRYTRKRCVDDRDARVCGIRGSPIGVDKRLDNAPRWQKVSPELPAPRDASSVAGQIVSDGCPSMRDKAGIIGELGSMIRAFLRVARSAASLPARDGYGSLRVATGRKEPRLLPLLILPRFPFVFFYFFFSSHCFSFLSFFFFCCCCSAIKIESSDLKLETLWLTLKRLKIDKSAIFWIRE